MKQIREKIVFSSISVAALSSVLVPLMSLVSACTCDVMKSNRQLVVNWKGNVPQSRRIGSLEKKKKSFHCFLSSFFTASFSLLTTVSTIFLYMDTVVVPVKTDYGLVSEKEALRPGNGGVNDFFSLNCDSIPPPLLLLYNLNSSLSGVHEGNNDVFHAFNSLLKILLSFWLFQAVPSPSSF